MYYDNAIDNLRSLNVRISVPLERSSCSAATASSVPVLNPFGGDALFNRGDITLAQALAILRRSRADLESAITQCNLPTVGRMYTDSFGPVVFVKLPGPVLSAILDRRAA